MYRYLDHFQALAADERDTTDAGFGPSDDATGNDNDVMTDEDDLSSDAPDTDTGEAP